MRKPNIERKTLLLALSVILLLFLALCTLSRDAGKIAAAVITALGALYAYFRLKKRRMPSVYRRTVLWLVTLTAVLYMTLVLLSGFHFGFFLADVPLSVKSFVRIILPLTVTIVATELIRNAILGQEGKLAYLLAYVLGVLSEVLMAATFAGVTNFYHFMNLAGMALIPALAGGALYQHLSAHYGVLPSLLYRLVVTLFPYLVPIKSGMPSSLVSFLALAVPPALLFFLRLLYAKKEKQARKKKNKWFYAMAGSVLLSAVCFILLISCQFRFGVLVIATESMSGEINKGDAAFFEKYTDQVIKVDDILVFDKNGSTIVHRVVDVVNIDGENRYYTKGDANEDADVGYITDQSIIGVVEAKLPYFGYPTLWLRDLFR